MQYSQNQASIRHGIPLPIDVPQKIVNTRGLLAKNGRSARALLDIAVGVQEQTLQDTR